MFILDHDILRFSKTAYVKASYDGELHNGCTDRPKQGRSAQLSVQFSEPKLLVPNTRRVEPGNC